MFTYVRTLFTLYLIWICLNCLNLNWSDPISKGRCQLILNLKSGFLLSRKQKTFMFNAVHSSFHTMDLVKVLLTDFTTCYAV